MKKYFICLIICFFNLQSFALENLKTYHIDLNSITVSGISSGAFMSIQMSVAYSKLFAGSASVAGGLYWCAQGQSKKAQGECMASPNNIKPEVQLTETRRLEKTGDIDPLENLARQQLYIFASPADQTVRALAGDKLYEFASQFISTQNIKIEKSIKAAHGFPTLNYGNKCNLSFSPYILKCDFDAAAEILKTMYTSLNPRAVMKAENLIQFNQSEFGPASAALHAKAWVYVPKSCQDGALCKLHVALHGCQMNPDVIQDQFVKNAGYNEWAESNNIIVLYPQATKLGLDNPNGCWDWFGYTGQNYATKSGVQMKILKAMIDRVTGQK